MEQTVPEETEQLSKEEMIALKVNKLIESNDVLSRHAVSDWLNADEMREYKTRLYTKLTQLELQQDIITRKLCDVAEVPLNELTRERNQRKIQLGIHRLLNKYGHMPNKTQLADYTGLSRKTIHKHMEEYMSSTGDLAQEYAIMAPQVINKVLKTALNGEGDIRAAKLYLDVTTKMLTAGNPPSMISVNGTVVTQADIERLSDEQRKKVLEAMKAG